jgi:hypothetical protein
MRIVSAIVLSLALISCGGDTPGIDSRPATDTGARKDSTRDAGAAKDTASGAPDCAQLATCCPTIESIYQVSCNSLVTAGDNEACRAAYQSWKGSGLCK